MPIVIVDFRGYGWQAGRETPQLVIQHLNVGKDHKQLALEMAG